MNIHLSIAFWLQFLLENIRITLRVIKNIHPTTKLGYLALQLPNWKLVDHVLRY